MVEVIDRSTNQKIMMMVLCGICYQSDYYLVYCIHRNKDEANIFVSKMLKGSLGYVINDNFLNGEKEVLDGIVRRILSKDSRLALERDGFTIFKEIDLDSNLTFDIEKCYVSTVVKSLIKDCLIYYGLVSEALFNKPVVEVIDDERKFNEGFVSNVVLIIFGIVILIFSCVVIYGIVSG